MSDETAAVEFQAALTEYFPKGRIAGLAIVDMLIGGVPITIQGVRLVRKSDGSLSAEPPFFRHPNGEWLPAVLLPDEVVPAIAAQIFDQNRARAAQASETHATATAVPQKHKRAPRR